MSNKKIIFLTHLLLLSGYSYSQDTSRHQQVTVDSSIFQKVEFESEFPGGDAAWIRYLQNNLNANIPIKNKAKKGTYRVVIKFIVSKDGTISNLTPETHFGYGMEEEVIRVIKEGPRWMPAMQNGRKVNAYRRQPVTFVVPD